MSGTIPMRWGREATRTVVGIKHADRKPKLFRYGADWANLAWNGGRAPKRSQRQRRLAARRGRR